MIASPRLTVVVMAYNEVGSFDATCSEILDALHRTDRPYELLIVDDGSTDGTERHADALAASSDSVRVIHHSPNLGLGGVYRTGFREARGECVTFFPADGQFPASIINEFLERIDDYSVVLGYLPRRDSSMLAKLLSSAERILYSLLFGTFPRFQGILMFKRELLARYQLRSAGRGWAILMEFILRCARDGVRMSSVPTDMRPRVFGASKVNNLQTIWSNYRQIIELRRLIR